MLGKRVADECVHGDILLGSILTRPCSATIAKASLMPYLQNASHSVSTMRSTDMSFRRTELHPTNLLQLFSDKLSLGTK